MSEVEAQASLSFALRAHNAKDNGTPPIAKRQVGCLPVTLSAVEG